MQTWHDDQAPLAGCRRVLDCVRPPPLAATRHPASRRRVFRRREFRPTETGFVYDVRMKAHLNVADGDDDSDDDDAEMHPEDPTRLWACVAPLIASGAVKRMRRIQGRVAALDEITMFHGSGYVLAQHELQYYSIRRLGNQSKRFKSLFLSAESEFCARLSCGSLLELCRAVAIGQVANGLAIIRPPGHHAEAKTVSVQTPFVQLLTHFQAMGFCIFNNIVYFVSTGMLELTRLQAVAAKYLQRMHGAKRIMIVDWDVHHGNGTQHAFYSDPTVLYVSIHRFDRGAFFPGSKDGNFTYIGEGPGRGRNVNIAWPKEGMADQDYLFAFQKVVIPIGREFAPDFILVSAGFDAADGDLIGGCKVTPRCYGEMTRQLMILASGRVIVALEGGYSLDVIGECMHACAQALIWHPAPPIPLRPYPPAFNPCPAARLAVKDTTEALRRYWQCLANTPDADFLVVKRVRLVERSKAPEPKSHQGGRVRVRRSNAPITHQDTLDFIEEFAKRMQSQEPYDKQRKRGDLIQLAADVAQWMKADLAVDDALPLAALEMIPETLEEEDTDIAMEKAPAVAPMIGGGIYKPELSSTEPVLFVVDGPR